LRKPNKKRVEEYIRNDSFCPWCGSEDITATGSMETDNAIAWQNVECNGCGAEWQDCFNLVAISWKRKKERLYSDEVFK
jgi:hypothetical protein